MSTWNKKRKVMRHYDQAAIVYDAQYCEEQEAKIRTAMENLTLNQNSLILDAGCGTGLLFKHIGEKTRFVVGIDISSRILKQAKKKVKQLKNVALILADADNMPFHKQAFDAVFAITLLQNTPHPAATLREVRRVSKSNATMVVTGLRKVFTQEEFVKTLELANLKTVILKLDEHGREYVCICTQNPPLSLNSALWST